MLLLCRADIQTEKTGRVLAWCSICRHDSTFYFGEDEDRHLSWATKESRVCSDSVCFHWDQPTWGGRCGGSSFLLEATFSSCSPVWGEWEESLELRLGCRYCLFSPGERPCWGLVFICDSQAVITLACEREYDTLLCTWWPNSNNNNTQLAGLLSIKWENTYQVLSGRLGKTDFFFFFDNRSWQANVNVFLGFDLEEPQM